MIVTKGKYFRKFTPRELFTEYIYSLMKQKKDFMVFTDNNQVLIGHEICEWINVNGILNSTERVLYHLVSNGYVVHYTEAITSVTVPFGLLEKNYEDFIKQCEEDLNDK